MSSHKNNQAKRNRQGAQARKSKSQPRRDPALQLRPEFPGQRLSVITLSSNPNLLQVPASGPLAVVHQITASLIPSIGSRFAAWEELRVVRVKATIRLFSSTMPGTIVQWFGSGSVTPSLTQSYNQSTERIPCSSVLKSHTLVYEPHDPENQQWSPLSFPAILSDSWFCYTDSNWGAVASSNIGSVTFDVTVQFRGLI